MSKRFTLRLIGPFSLEAPDGAAIAVPSRKGMALIALLAMSPNGTRTRAWLQNMLWESRSPPQAQGSLRRELSNLAAQLRSAGADGLLRRDQSRVSLALDKVWIDAVETGLGTPALPGTGDCEFLEGIDLPDSEAFEEWLRNQRARCSALNAYRYPEPQTSPDVRQVLGTDLPPTLDIIRDTKRSLPPKPSVVIMPLECIGVAEADDDLGRAVAEEIELGLASYRSLFVVSTISARALAKRNLTTSEIAEKLGVHYLVDGALRQAGDRLRVNIVLIEGASGQQVWAQRYEVGRADLFTLQHQIAEQVAPRIHTRIDQIQLQGGISRTALSGDAYGLYWRANALSRQWERAPILEAIALSEELVALEPAAGWAAAIAAFSYACAYASGWLEDPDAGKQAATIHYQNALRYGGSDHAVLGYAAATLVLVGGDMDVADRLLAQSLNLLPNYQPNLFWGGWSDIIRGDPGRARERFELSLRINPEAGVRDYAITGIGIALLMQGNVADAFEMLSDSIIHIPTFPFTLAAHCVAATLLGKHAAAAQSARVLASTNGAAGVLALLRDPALRAMIEAAISQAGQASPQSVSP